MLEFFNSLDNTVTQLVSSIFGMLFGTYWGWVILFFGGLYLIGRFFQEIFIEENRLKERADEDYWKDGNRQIYIQTDALIQISRNIKYCAVFLAIIMFVLILG